MIKRKLSVPWLVFSLLCLLGVCILFFPGYRFSAWVTFGLACLVALYQLLRLSGRRYPKFSRICRHILTAGVCLVAVAAAITGGLIVHTGMGAQDDDCGYLIVLGAGVNGTVPSLTLRERLEATANYMQAHPEAVCIVSGGQGPGEDITEADCMARWLSDKGIDPQRIWLEPQATSTQENLAFSMDLIEDKTGYRPQTVGIVSSEYHLYRAGLMAQDKGIDPILIPAKTTWISLRLNYYLREIAGVWYYCLFGE